MARVLIVDDDTDLLDMVSMALSQYGFDISTLTSGAPLYKKVENFQPDIVLMDIFLGDADGRALCYELKDQPLYQQIPVILYSAGHVPRASVERARANAFLAKPFDIRHLVEKIKQLIGMN